jgi:hypothetical protein
LDESLIRSLHTFFFFNIDPGSADASSDAAPSFLLCGRTASLGMIRKKARQRIEEEEEETLKAWL